MVKWTPKSESDLEEILEHVAMNFTIDLAVKAIDDIIEYTEMTLSKNPLAGSVLESNPFFSKLIHKGNSLFYCENPKDKNLYIVYVQPRKTDFKLDRVNKEEVA